MPRSQQCKKAATIAGLVATLILAGCSGGMDRNPGDGIHDPYETRNRKVHAFNKELDRDLIRPLAIGYSRAMPDEFEDSIGHFATNLGQPSVTVNSLLQGDLRGAGISFSRFLINSTLGFGGLFDVASDFGVEQHDTDFGETLHVWGAEEGAYVEAPLFGPSTTRDSIGRVVDFFTNPLSYELDDPERYTPPAASALAGIGDRGRYSETVDSILYDSADSYSQARLIYLQNRRFQLGIGDESTEIDPFALNTEGF